MAGEVRVTRQYVDVLYAAAGTTRVTRQYVDVLMATTVFAADPTDELSIDTEVVAEHIRAVADTVTVSGVVESTVEWVSSKSEVATVSQTLESQGPHYVHIQHTINASADAQLRHAVINVTCTHTLGVTHKSGRVITVDVEHEISMSEDMYRPATSASTVDISQTVAAGKGRVVASECAVSHSVTAGANVTLPVSTLATVHQAVTFYVVSNCVLKRYHPFVGSTTDTLTPPNPVAPVYSRQTLTLTYPFTTPTSTVVLRNAEFNNRDQISTTRINRTSRGGTLLVYSDPVWPTTRTIQLDVVSLTAAQASDLKMFLIQSLGKEIGLLDHKGAQWRGLVTNPTVAVSHPDNSGFFVSLEFEGVIC